MLCCRCPSRRLDVALEHARDVRDQVTLQHRQPIARLMRPFSDCCWQMSLRFQCCFYRLSPVFPSHGSRRGQFRSRSPIVRCGAGLVNGFGKKLGLVAAATFLVGALGVLDGERSFGAGGPRSRVAEPGEGARRGPRSAGELAAASDGWRLTGDWLCDQGVAWRQDRPHPRSQKLSRRRTEERGNAYTFTVAAVSKSGTGPASRRSAAIRPHAPTVPGTARSIVAAAGFKQITVSWAAPKSDGGAPITAYRLSTSPATQAVSAAGDARSLSLTGLSDGRAYRVSVAAVNAAGRSKAAFSASARPHVTVPSAPAGITAAPGASWVLVSWQPPASTGGSPVTGYVVTVAGTARKITAAGSARSVKITGLASGRRAPHGRGQERDRDR